jgi:hypothetical protein
VRSSRRKSGPSNGQRPLGSECCVVTGDGGCEAYTAIAWGVGLSHERSYIAGAEGFHSLEGNMCGTVLQGMRGAVALPGSKATSRAKGSHRNLGGLGFDRNGFAITGPHREGEEPKPMMNGPEKSDPVIVVRKPANKAARSATEPSVKEPPADVSLPRTVFQRLGGDPDDRWIFATDRVWIEHRDGSIVGQRSDPRAAFAGHDASRQGTTPTHQTATTQFVEGSDGMVADDACCEMPSIARPSSSN